MSQIDNRDGYAQAELSQGHRKGHHCNYYHHPTERQLRRGRNRPNSQIEKNRDFRKI